MRILKVFVVMDGELVVSMHLTRQYAEQVLLQWKRLRIVEGNLEMEDSK